MIKKKLGTIPSDAFKRNLLQRNTKRVVVYSFVTNNKNKRPFPTIKFVNNQVDYVMFTDDVGENEKTR